MLDMLLDFKSVQNKCACLTFATIGIFFVEMTTVKICDLSVIYSKLLMYKLPVDMYIYS